MTATNTIPDDYDFTDANPATDAEKNHARLVLALKDIRAALDGPDQDEPVVLRGALREVENSIQYVLSGL